MSPDDAKLCMRLKQPGYPPFGTDILMAVSAIERLSARVAELERECAELRKALVGMVGVDTEDELRGMLKVVQSDYADREDNGVASAAINVLLRKYVAIAAEKP